jgi:hypothetical protein
VRLTSARRRRSPAFLSEGWRVALTLEGSTRWSVASTSKRTDQDLNGDLGADPTAAPQPGTGYLNVFYIGRNNLRMRVRGLTGDWSGELPVGNNSEGFLNVQKILAAQVPETDILHLFYLKPDGSAWTRWWDPMGGWSNEKSLARGVNSNLAVACFASTKPAVGPRLQDEEASYSPGSILRATSLMIC